MYPHPTPPASSKPFLKWAGGKSRLLSQLLPLFPAGNRLIEPFVGAGSVFLSVNFDQYVLNDANPDLIAGWVALKCLPTEFVNRAAVFFQPGFHTQEAYLRIRAEFNAEIDRFERAIRLPYLNKFGFNGLYRVNKAGGFNVPYGNPKKLPTFPWAQFEAAVLKLQRCDVYGGGFEAVVAMAGKGDVVYCDPPYWSEEGAFTAYTQANFDIKDHQALVRAAKAAVERGATVLISNFDNAATRELYAGWEIKELVVQRTLAAKAEHRRSSREFVAFL